MVERNQGGALGPFREIPQRPPIYADRERIVRIERFRGRIVDLADGISPYDPPEEFSEIDKQIHEDGSFMRAVMEYGADLDPAIGHIRERFNLSEAPYVVISGGGSDEILERVITRLLRDKSHLFAIGPHFSPIIDYLMSYGYENRWARRPRIRYSPVTAESVGIKNEAPLYVKLDTMINAMTYSYDQYRTRNVMVYLATPDTPKGDAADIGQIEELAKLCARKHWILVIDEAFGDFLPDSQSAIPLTEKYRGLIVTRSLSKAFHLPGMRIGYAVMSKDVGELYSRAKRRYDMPGDHALIANRLLDPSIIVPYFDGKREEVTTNKKAFMLELSIRGLEILPTSASVPIMVVDGGSPGYHGRLVKRGVITASCEDFNDTHPDMTDQQVRVSITRNRKDIPMISRRFAKAA